MVGTDMKRVVEIRNTHSRLLKDNDLSLHVNGHTVYFQNADTDENILVLGKEECKELGDVFIALASCFNE